VVPSARIGSIQEEMVERLQKNIIVGSSKALNKSSWWCNNHLEK
jgi:hypothetical protein